MYLEFMQELLETNGIPVHRISPPYIVEEWMDLGLRAEILNISDPNAVLSNALSQLPERTIHYFTDEFLCNYTSFLLPDSGECFLAGPMLFEAISESRLFKRITGMTPKVFRETKTYQEFHECGKAK